MSLWKKIKGELIDIIGFLDERNDTLVHRFERYQNEIKNGAKLTVRPSQIAVFVNEGQVADTFEPGMYELTTENLPVLSTLKGWKYGFNSPFKAEVYFINTKVFADQKWGTPEPVPFTAPDVGPMRVRAFGSYHFQVKDPVKLIEKLSGTDDHFTTDDATNYIRDFIMEDFPDAFCELSYPALDIGKYFKEISQTVQDQLTPVLVEKYGIEIVKFNIASITFPEEVQQAIDKRGSMNILGNMGQYSQYQAAQSMEKAADNPSGGASEGIGMGMGFGMASQMMQQMNQPQQANQGGAPPPVPGASSYFIAVDGKQNGPFGMNTLNQMAVSGKLTPETLVWKDGMANWTKVSDVPELDKLFGSTPPPLPPK